MISGMRAPAVHTRWVTGILVTLVFALAVSRLIPAGGELPAAADLVHRTDLNRAPWHELVNLPGIGEAKARAIVRERRLRGPFGDLGDLERVPGIGPGTLERIRSFTVKER